MIRGVPQRQQLATERTPLTTPPRKSFDLWGPRRVRSGPSHRHLRHRCAITCCRRAPPPAPVRGREGVHSRHFDVYGPSRRALARRDGQASQWQLLTDLLHSAPPSAIYFLRLCASAISRGLHCRCRMCCTYPLCAVSCGLRLHNIPVKLGSEVRQWPIEVPQWLSFAQQDD